MSIVFDTNSQILMQNEDARVYIGDGKTFLYPDYRCFESSYRKFSQAGSPTICHVACSTDAACLNSSPLASFLFPPSLYYPLHPSVDTTAFVAYCSPSFLIPTFPAIVSLSTSNLSNNIMLFKTSITLALALASSCFSADAFGTHRRWATVHTLLPPAAH